MKQNRFIKKLIGQLKALDDALEKSIEAGYRNLPCCGDEDYESKEREEASKQADVELNSILNEVIKTNSVVLDKGNTRV